MGVRRTKFLALLLVAVLCMTMFPVSAAAATDGIDVKIQLDKETVYPGDEVTATVYLTQNAGFTMLVFDVDYDEAVFEYVSGSTVYNTSVLSGGMEAPENSTRLGWMLADETSNTTATGAVATLTFKAIATGTASFSISVPQVGGAITWDYETVSLTSQPTSVTVSVNPSTCSHSYSAWSVTKAATCTAKGSQSRTCSLCGNKQTKEITALGHSYDSGEITKPATTTSTGVKTYTCTRCSGSYTETIPQLTSTLSLGDVNGDGQVNLKDVTKLFQYVNKQISSLEHEDVSDINHDGAINLKDVTKLFQYVNKQISSL
jgi:hypothetical protein